MQKSSIIAEVTLTTLELALILNTVDSIIMVATKTTSPVNKLNRNKEVINQAEIVSQNIFSFTLYKLIYHQ